MAYDNKPGYGTGWDNYSFYYCSILAFELQARGKHDVIIVGSLC